MAIGFELKAMAKVKAKVLVSKFITLMAKVKALGYKTKTKNVGLKAFKA